jgi:hypothetical protein
MIKSNRLFFLFPLDFCSVNLKSAIRHSQCAILVSAILFALCISAQAQQPKKVHRIGYLLAGDPTGESTRFEAIRVALRELGYIEGQNIAFEYRYAEGKLDRLPELAADLVRLKVDIIVVAGRTIPIRAGQECDQLHGGRSRTRTYDLSHVRRAL